MDIRLSRGVCYVAIWWWQGVTAYFGSGVALLVPASSALGESTLYQALGGTCGQLFTLKISGRKLPLGRVGTAIPPPSTVAVVEDPLPPPALPTPFEISPRILEAGRSPMERGGHNSFRVQPNGTFSSCGIVSSLHAGGSQPWPPIRITHRLLKPPMPGPHPKGL